MNYPFHSDPPHGMNYSIDRLFLNQKRTKQSSYILMCRIHRVMLKKSMMHRRLKNKEMVWHDDKDYDDCKQQLVSSWMMSRVLAP